MAERVIQGFFIAGQPRPLPGSCVGARVQRSPAPAAGRAGPPAPAFSSGAAPLQAQGANASFAVDPVQLGLARSGGVPLPGPLLAKMEAAFGADFSGVRVHVGPQAARIGAIAFTTGNDLYFAPGRYQPDSVQGQQLIGHELAHVVQQRQGRVHAPGSGISVVQDHALEAEADRLGIRAAMHRAAPLQARMALGAGRPRLRMNRTLQRAAAKAAPKVSKGELNKEYPFGAANSVPHIHKYATGAHLKIVSGGTIKSLKFVNASKVKPGVLDEAIKATNDASNLTAAQKEYLVALIKAIADSF